MTFLLAILLGIEVNLKEIKLDQKIELGEYVLQDNNTINTRTFTLGDSNFQIAEKEAESRRDRERYSQVNRNTSYTGKGMAKKIEKDEIYKNCVEYAKAKTGISRTIGNGGRKGINTQEPVIGSIGVEAGRVPHAVVVMSVEGENITFLEANYLVDKDGTHWITERTLKRADFLGFII